ncbi:MAG: dethiobiotin synthase [Cycloclasticus sp.]|nr:MAG: dethiobiotin synthase [Cycloclasticus sp.]
MAKGFFITGTDTGVGKTYVASQLIKAYRKQGVRVSGFKPVASGGVWLNDQLVNEDALSMMREASVSMSYTDVNPYCFEPAIAPHLAAEQARVDINFEKIQSHYRKHVSEVDIVIVEGAGGWKVPLNEELSFDEIPLVLEVPVILVVGLKLGCINHALLTEEAILNSGCRLVGWIGNSISADFEVQNDNSLTLSKRMKSPCIGFFEHAFNKVKKNGVGQINIASTLDYLTNFR